MPTRDSSLGVAAAVLLGLFLCAAPSVAQQPGGVPDGRPVDGPGGSPLDHPGGSPSGDPSAVRKIDPTDPDAGVPDIETMAPGLFPPDGEQGAGRIPPMEPERRQPKSDPNGEDDLPPRDGAAPAPGLDGGDPAGARSQPGEVGPPLGRLESWVVTPEPERLLLASPEGDLVLCDPSTGVCAYQGHVEEEGRPVCATSLRNGWLWALSRSGLGTSLCTEGCGRGYNPGQPPPLPAKELSLLPEGTTTTCGNALDGTSYWIGTRSAQRWSGVMSDIQSLPGSMEASNGPSAASAGQLWLVRDGRLWSRPWRGQGAETFHDAGDVGPDAAFWPAACQATVRRVDELIVVAPSARGVAPGLRAGLWSLGPCGLVAITPHDLPTGRVEPVLWPDEVLHHAAWPPPEPLHGELAESLFVHVAVRPPGEKVKALWTANLRTGSLFAPLKRALPMAELTGVISVSNRAYALGDGLVALGTQRRVGLIDALGKPYGRPRLGVSHRVEGGTYEVVVTAWPAALWLWVPGRPRPNHLQVADSGRPDLVEELKFTTLPDGVVALAYRVGAQWWIQSTALGAEPRKAEAAPASAVDWEAPAPTAGPGQATTLEEEAATQQGRWVMGLLVVIGLLGGVWWFARRK